jgi:hypothetical protein
MTIGNGTLRNLEHHLYSKQRDAILSRLKVKNVVHVAAILRITYARLHLNESRLICKSEFAVRLVLASRSHSFSEIGRM